MNTAFRTKQRGSSWNPVVLGVAALIAFLMIGLNACSSASPDAAKTNKPVSSTTSPQAAKPASVTPEEGVPATLSNAREYGEDLYDYAKANDWNNADVKIAELKHEIKDVPTDVNNKSAPINNLSLLRHSRI